MIKNKKLMSELSSVWENTDGCADQYRCATALYLMLVLSQRQSLIFDWGISAPGHVKGVVDGLLSDNSKQDAATTTAHSNVLIELLKKICQN